MLNCIKFKFKKFFRGLDFLIFNIFIYFIDFNFFSFEVMFFKKIFFSQTLIRLYLQLYVINYCSSRTFILFKLLFSKHFYTCINSSTIHPSDYAFFVQKFYIYLFIHPFFHFFICSTNNTFNHLFSHLLILSPLIFLFYFFSIYLLIFPHSFHLWLSNRPKFTFSFVSNNSSSYTSF